MNHILEEILRDWAAKDGHIQMLQEELEKARAATREYLRGQENRRAECEDLKREIAAQNKVIARLKDEILAMREAHTMARELGMPKNIPPDTQGREA